MPEHANEKFKILIVDDVPKNIQVVANILQNEGYNMAFAQSGATAVELVRANPFDLILLDIMMPEMDGFEVCRRLQEDPKTADIPVLFLTAKTDTESLVKGFETGAVDYVTKPVKDAELLARVKTQLELHRSRQRLLSINKQLNEEIKERKKSEARYRSMVGNAVQGMFQSTIDGRIIDINPAYARILGYDSPEEVMAAGDLSSTFYFQPEDRSRMVDQLKKEGFLANYELKIRRRDGSPAWVMLNLRLTEDESGQSLVDGIVIEHTATKLAEEELRRSREKFRYQAVHDNLTGLYNTRYLYQALQKLVEACSARAKPFSLIFMDVDDFKKVVDTYGHLKGSQTLQELARTIQDSLTEPSYGVAYGGDEFVVVLPGYDKERALAKAGEIRARIRETAYLTSHGHDVHIHASFGIATFPEDAGDVTGLLALADQAMFDVKGGGKDAVRASSAGRS